jgi:hypothetical protein
MGCRSPGNSTYSSHPRCSFWRGTGPESQSHGPQGTILLYPLIWLSDVAVPTGPYMVPTGTQSRSFYSIQPECAKNPRSSRFAPLCVLPVSNVNFGASVRQHKYMHIRAGLTHSTQSLQRPLVSHVRVNDFTAHVSDSIRRLR